MLKEKEVEQALMERRRGKEVTNLLPQRVLTLCVCHLCWAGGAEDVGRGLVMIFKSAFKTRLGCVSNC